MLEVKIARDRSKRLQVYFNRLISIRFLCDFACTTQVIDTPIDQGCALSLDQCPKTKEEKNQISKVSYATTIKSLMYAMLDTHLDISYAVELLGRYQSNLSLTH